MECRKRRLTKAFADFGKAHRAIDLAVDGPCRLR